MTRYLLWVIAPHHQHITASSLHFTRCHYILQELAKYPSRIEKIWQALLSSSIATKPVVKTLIWRASNSCGLTKSWNQPDKKQLQGEQQNRKDNFGKSLYQEKTKSPNLLSFAPLCIIPRQLWEVLKWWKPMCHTWHYSEASVLSLSARWECAGLRQTWRELSAKMAEQHHLCSSSELSHRPSMRATGERGEHWGAGEINQSHVHYPCMCVAHCFGGICLCALACTYLCVYCCHFN